MEKAYDTKALVEKLKARGVDVAEEAAKAVVEETFDWAAESAQISATPVDNLIAPFYPQAKAFVLEQVDKIDGKVGA